MSMALAGIDACPMEATREQETCPMNATASWRTICAWCSKHLKGQRDAELVSHGICSDCRDKANASAKHLPMSAYEMAEWED